MVQVETKAKVLHAKCNQQPLKRKHVDDERKQNLLKIQKKIKITSNTKANPATISTKNVVHAI